MTASNERMVVEAAGCITAVGSTLAETAASMNAGISRQRRSPYVGLDGQHFRVAPVLQLRPDLTGAARGILLVRPALRECLSTLRGMPSASEPVALLMCLDAPPRVHEASACSAHAAARLAAAWTSVIDAAAEETTRSGFRCIQAEGVFSGPADGASVLNRAREILRGGEVARVLVGGVSSACEPARLEWLDARMRAMPPFLRYPIVGGEAGAFVSCSLEKGPPARAAHALAELEGEAVSAVRPVAPPAEALTDVLDRVMSLGGAAPSSLVVDIPDSRELGKELITATMRTFGVARIVPEIIRPAAFVGQVGAATIPLFVALACSRRAITSIVASVSDAGLRSAVRVAAIGATS